MFTLIALSFYLLLDTFRPEVLFPGTGPGIMLWAGIALLVCCVTEMLLTGRGWRSLPPTRYAIGLMAAAMLSFGLAYFRGEGASETANLLDLPKAVVIYLVIIQTIHTERRLAYVRWLLVILITGLALGGICFSLGMNLPGYNLEREGRLQYAGIFNDSNDLGLMFVVGWAVLIFSLINTRGFWRRLLFLVWLGPLAWAIVLTASRGAMLAALTAVFLTFRRRFGMVIPGIIALGLLVTANRMGIARMDRLAMDEESAEGRIASWGQGWYMLRSHPILGVGPHNFLLYHNKAPHSTVVQVAAETGLIGLICWVGFFYFPLQEFTRLDFIRNKTGTGPPFSVQQLQAALMACIVAGLFLSRLYINTPDMLAGLVMVARDLQPKEEEEKLEQLYTPQLSLQTLALLVIGLLIVWRLTVRQFVSGI